MTAHEQLLKLLKAHLSKDQFRKAEDLLDQAEALAYTDGVSHAHAMAIIENPDNWQLDK